MPFSLTAYLNQRFQWTTDVTTAANVYPSSIGSAVWQLQIRPQAGSPVVTLDFRTGGSPQSANLTAAYNSGAKNVVFNAPTSLVAGLAAGTYSFDFGFILTNADFERIDGGTIEFIPGVTLAGVTGSPSPPTSSDDTVSSSAASATATATGSSGGFFAEALTVTSTNTVSTLTHAWSGLFAILSVRGQVYFPVGGSAAFIVSGSTLTWNSTNAGFDLSPGDSVSILYSK